MHFLSKQKVIKIKKQSLYIEIKIKAMPHSSQYPVAFQQIDN